MFDRVTYDVVFVQINGFKLSGVQGVDGEFNVPYVNLQAIGLNTTHNVAQGPLEAQFGVSRYIVGDDPIRYLTGEFFTTGHLEYGGKTFGFHTGYLTNYNVSVAVGEIPQLQTDFITYGSIGGGISSPTLNPAGYPIEITKANSISSTLDEASTNRVVSFDYTVNVNREPYYGMGSLIPFQIDTIYPIEIALSLNVEIDDSYECNELKSLICSPLIQNIQLDFRTCDSSSSIISYSMSNAKLYSEKWGSSVNNSAVINLVYKTILERG